MNNKETEGRREIATGDVCRYVFRWSHEAKLENGKKLRRCIATVLNIGKGAERIVALTPITTLDPGSDHPHAVEIKGMAKHQAGLTSRDRTFAICNKVMMVKAGQIDRQAAMRGGAVPVIAPAVMDRLREKIADATVSGAVRMNRDIWEKPADTMQYRSVTAEKPLKVAGTAR